MLAPVRLFPDNNIKAVKRHPSARLQENGQIRRASIPEHQSVEVSPGPEASEDLLFARRAERVLVQFQCGELPASPAKMVD